LRVGIRRYSRRLSRTLGIGQLVAAVASFVIAGFILTAYQFVSLRQALRDDVEVQASIVGDNIAASLMFKDRAAANEILRSFSHADYLTSVLAYDNQGKLFAAYHSAATPPTEQLSVELGEAGSKDVSVVRTIRYRGNALGSVVLVANVRSIWTRLVKYGILFALASLAAVAVGWLVLRRTNLRMARAERELDYLAYTDPVTSLPNRRSSYMALERELTTRGKSGEHFAVLIIDLDNFKTVNDTAGHGVGDQLLGKVGSALSAAVRPTDLVGRIGGDEFLVIAAPIRDRDEAFAISHSVINAFRQPFLLGGAEIFATVSVGVSLFPDDAGALSELLSSADIALYHAKMSGKNRFSGFVPQMTLAAQRRVRIERDLRKAMERDELDVFYQPQFDCLSDRIVGFEALARWPHADHGYIAPSDFIPVAEETGLIGELGLWVLRRACMDTVAWSEASGVALGLAVNVSARQLRERAFVDQVADILRETGLPAAQLELELTESFLMGDVEAALAFMRALREMGVKLSIDDFGTGYSSLSYLQSFPIDRLKIDRSFVQLLPDDGFTMTSAIISLAHGFDLSVVAEGVEAPAQLSWLKDAGCDFVQGYLMARPMPASAVRALLLAQTPVVTEPELF
jgi:diguanylate cyclase (GGDEF)-like protein